MGRGSRVSNEAGRRWRLAFFVVLAACTREGAVVDSTGGTKPTEQVAANLPALEGWGKARPIDEASKDPSLVAFRDTLLDIARRKDSAALHARIHRTVKFSFGDSQGGPSGLFAYWHKYQSMEKLWATLTDVLEHGGRFSDPQSFYAPWTFGPLPGDSLDAFEFLFVRDSNVVVHEAADAGSRAMGTLGYDVVRSNGGPVDSTWRSIKLRDGRSGYVRATQVRSPVDYRIGLRRIEGRWMIDFFVAGD